MDSHPSPLESIREALNVLGAPSTCSAHECEGCEWERLEANLVLARALAAEVEEACSICEATGYVDPALDSKFDMDLCPECKGSGIGPNFHPFSWSKTYQEYFLEATSASSRPPSPSAQ